jgi:peptidoglycan/LPS O-acetylase OafA/YrhL
MKGYISTLTPLRGIAAVLVVLLHSHIFLYPLAAPWTGGFVTKGWVWVDFFFVLSGFILCHVYGDAFLDGFSKPAYLRYLRARFARVYPLHFITLFWVLAAGSLVLTTPIRLPQWDRFFHIIFDVRTVPATLTLVQAMHLFPTAPLNTVSWSLSTEWWMYLLFPVLAPVLLRRARSWVWVVAVAGLYGLVKYWLVPTWGMHMGKPLPATLDTINDFGFLRCGAGFMLGMVCYRWYRTGWGVLLRRDAAFWGIGGLIFGGLYFDVNELVVVGLFPFFILAAAYNSAGVAQLLERRWAQRLGDWSFSIYMVHMPLFFTYRGIVPVLGSEAPEGFFMAMPVRYGIGWLYFAGFLAVTLVTAAVFYKYVEVPARNYLGRRVVRQRGVARGLS